MLLDKWMLLKYVPFEDEGFNFEIVWISSFAFSWIFSGLKETLPMLAWIIPNLSTLKSILPAFTSFTAFPTSRVTVPDLGFGIRPLGPNTLPNLPTLAITLGIVMMTSTSVQPPSILAM